MIPDKLILKLINKFKKNVYDYRKKFSLYVFELTLESPF